MKPLVVKKYRLEKFPGKGGWTFARIREVPQDKSNRFGWVKVRVIIDGHEIRKYKLMPMGDGKLFLPARSDIRKKIGKKEGDMVHVILYPDNEPVEVPEEFLICLNDEPSALKFFNTLSDGDKLSYIKWIFSVKKDHAKVERMATAINRLLRKQKFNDKHHQ